jgi:hypothetical protein
MLKAGKTIRNQKPEPPYLQSLCSSVEQWRGATVQRKAGGASLLVGGKVFAFTRPGGIAMKLPENRIRALLTEREAGFLVMGKRTMREWMLLRLDSTVRKEDLGLLREAMEFVAGKKS